MASNPAQGAARSPEWLDIEDFAPTRSTEPRDFCSQTGAQELKARIEAYWRARGNDVMVVLEDAGFHPAIRVARHDVRSDMLNGMPRTSARRGGGK